MSNKKEIDHSGRAHALLSPSSSSRWMSCPPSARFEEQFPPQPSSKFAEEGTLAHEFAEINLRHRNGTMCLKDFEKELQRLRDHELYTDEMEEEVEKYVNIVMEDYLTAKLEAEMLGEPSPDLNIEERFSLEKWIEGGFGSNDSSVVSTRKLIVHDLKYGKGVPVLADDNPQLKLYALGALEKLTPKRRKEIEVIELVIVQPRLDVESRWTITPKDLLEWAKKEVKVKAELAYKGEGEFKAGEHCKWCRAKPKCKAIFNFAVSSAKLEFATEDEPEMKPHPNLIEDEELLKIYRYTDMISDWLKEVGKHLLSRALEGEKFPGYKLVKGQSRRKIADERSVIENLTLMGYDKREFTNTKLKGIGDLQKILGVSFSDLVAPHITVVQNSPSLVQEMVEREPYSATESAKADFGS